MPRKGFKHRSYAVNRGKRKRSNKHKGERFGFRKSMLRSLDELELGDHLPGYKELKNLFDSEETTIQFFLEKGIIDCPTECVRCNAPLREPGPKHTVRCRRPHCAYACPKECQRCENSNLKIMKDKDGEEVRATCPDCQWEWRPGVEYERSIFRNSFVQDAKVPKNEILHGLWLWLYKVPSTTTAHMLIWDEATASAWYKFFRQMVSQMLDHDSEDNMLGGYDEDGNPIIVEVDETKMGKRKYNKGRRVSASWVIGMVERTLQRKTAWVVVEKRNASVCTAVIRKFIKPGSIIHSDEWGGYNPIKKMGLNYEHRRLCHKREFVNTTDGFGTHTQTIEGNNSAVKEAIPVHKRNGEDLQDCLFEFMWRRNNAGKLWPAVLEGLSTVRYTIPELLRVNEVDEPWQPTDVLIAVDEMEDYDSNATSETESEDESGAHRGAGGGGGARGAASEDTAGGARRQQRWRGQPMVEAVPSAVFRVREEEAAAAEAELARQLGPEDGVGPTVDGKRGII